MLTILATTASTHVYAALLHWFAVVNASVSGAIHIDVATSFGSVNHLVSCSVYEAPQLRPAHTTIKPQTMNPWLVTASTRVSCDDEVRFALSIAGTVAATVVAVAASWDVPHERRPASSSSAGDHPFLSDATLIHRRRP